METTTKKPASKKGLHATALGFSTLVHLCILFLVGGAIIIQGNVPRSPMVADLPNQAPDETPAPEEQTVPEDLPETQAEQPVSEPATPVPESAMVDAVQMPSVQQNQVFTMPQSAPGTAVAAFGASSTSATESPTVSTKAPVRSMPNPFGIGEVSKDGLVGYLYDLKQNDKKKPFPGKYDPSLFYSVSNNFINEDWNEKILEPYYKVKKPLTTYQFCIPEMAALEVPKAYNVEKDIQAFGILMHYKGNFISPKTGTFRFVGSGDDILFVRLNKKNVLNASLPGATATYPGQVRLAAGEWFRLTKGEDYAMEVLIGEGPGGQFSAFLMIEDKSEKAPMDTAANIPILPLFQTVPTKIPKYPPSPASKYNPRVADESFAGLEHEAANP